jgi:hypothetical protein
VVGCNRGLGLEITKALQAGGVVTFGTSRKPCEELASLGVTVIPGKLMLTHPIHAVYVYLDYGLLH